MEHRRIKALSRCFRSDWPGLQRSLSAPTRQLSPHGDGRIRADVIHPLDECLALPATREETERSLALTLRWASRSKAANAHGPGGQALFGIVQGGGDEDLRRRAVEETRALGFDGYAIGGMAVGEPKPLMLDLVELTAGPPSIQPAALSDGDRRPRGPGGGRRPRSGPLRVDGADAGGDPRGDLRTIQRGFQGAV